MGLREEWMSAPRSEHPITVSTNGHRVRVVLGGFIVAETTRALTLQEASLAPVQYIPREDVRMDLLEPTAHRTRCPYKGEASYFKVTAGGLERDNAAWSYEEPLAAAREIAGRIAFQPGRVDAIEEFAD
jgi:uncharacterized protein (DUF427 family)